MATELSANNPDLIESIRRNMGNRPDSNSNNTEPTGLLKKLNSTKILLFFLDQNNPSSS
jgi:hypothetical protein